MNHQSKAAKVVGWIISVLIGLMLAFAATMKFLNPPEVAAEIGKFGYPEGVMFYIGIAEVACAIVYFIPQTSILGAVLLTGYLGGAIATHVRIQDNFLAPALVGVFVWLALYLREPRLRTLLPVRSRPAQKTTD